MAKTTKQTIKEGNDFIERFGEGLRKKATIEKPTKPHKLNKRVDTIGVLRNEFLLNRQGKFDSPETIRTYKNHFDRIQDFIGYMVADDTVKAQFKGEFADYTEAYQEYMRNEGAKAPISILETPNFCSYYADFLTNTRGLKEQTVISCLRHLRAIIYFAQENKWIEDFKVSIKEKEPPLKTAYTKGELQRLVRRPKDEDDFVEVRNWVMIKYIMSTANRISSVLSLKVGDVDFENNEIRVNVQKNKRPKPYTLNHALRQVLREYINHWRTDEEGNPLLDAFLFPNRYGDELSYSSCRQAMERYFEDRHVPFGGFHKFRYTYAMTWIQDKGDPFTLKEQLGHSSLAMTNHYVKVFGRSHAEEVEQHSLISKVSATAGRKSLKKRKD